jgi:hypothetical protein
LLAFGPRAPFGQAGGFFSPPGLALNPARPNENAFGLKINNSQKDEKQKEGQLD